MCQRFGDRAPAGQLVAPGQQLNDQSLPIFCLDIAHLIAHRYGVHVLKFHYLLHPVV